jgi:ankyrin repeat protein
MSPQCPTLAAGHKNWARGTVVCEQIFCLSVNYSLYYQHRSDAVVNKPILVDPSEKIKEKTQTLVEGNILNKMKYMEQLKAEEAAREQLLRQQREAGIDNYSIISSTNTLAKTKRLFKHGLVRGKIVLPSIVRRESVMIPLDNLRLCRCRRHGNTLLMSAVRFDDLLLAEFIIKRIQQANQTHNANASAEEGQGANVTDIDIENGTGDTALTLACRLGKLRFVELLIQNGANVNMETSTGRTPLIEAVKAPSSSVEICLYLTQNGASVRYKTQKHGHMAMKWARRMQLIDTMRVLELAGIVQSEIVALFNAISVGDQAKVGKLVGVGDVFDANGEANLYVSMEDAVKQARLEDKRAKELRQRAGELTEQIEKARTHVQNAEQAVTTCTSEMHTVAGQLDNVSVDINAYFVNYEHACKRLLVSDIEELMRLRSLDEVLCVALYTLGILFGFLPNKIPPANTNAHKNPQAMISFITSTSKQWWPELLAKAFKTKPSAAGGDSDEDDDSQAGTQGTNAQSTNAAKPRTGGHSHNNSKSVLRSFHLFTQEKLSGVHGTTVLARVPALFKALQTSLMNNHHDEVTQLMSSKRKLVTSKKSARKSGKSEFDVDLDAQTTVSKQLDTQSIVSEQTQERPPSQPSQPSQQPQQQPDIGSIKVWGSENNFSSRSKQAEEAVAKARKQRQRTHKLALALEDAAAAADDKQDEDDDEDKTLEYDSDTDEAWGGKWVKGKWVSERVYKNQENASKPRNKHASAKDQQPDYSKLTLQQYKALIEQTTSAASTSGRSTAVGSPVGTSRRPSRLTRSNTQTSLLTADTQRSEQSSLGPIENDAFVRAALGELDDCADGFVIPQIVLTVYCLLTAGQRLHTQQTEIDRIKAVYVEKGRNLTIANDTLANNRGVFDQLEGERAEVEKELIQFKKNARFTLEKAKNFREKLRVWRLLNQVTASGHTAISWAACRGNFEAMDALLLHGASVGFTSSLVHLSATYLQHSYRLYKLSYKQQRKAVLAELDPAAALELENQSQIQASESGEKQKPVIEQIALVKEQRTRVLNKILFQRRRIRLPMPEAAYAGKYEIIRRIWDRKMYHHHFSHSWCQPLAPPPYLIQTNASARVTNRQQGAGGAYSKKTHMWDLLLQGEEEMGAGRYDGDLGGWVKKFDPRDFHGEGKVELTDIMQLVKAMQDKKRAERARIRAIVMANRQRSVGEDGMIDAIKRRDFQKVMELVTNNNKGASGASSCSIDYECPDGRTALMAAAEENITLPTHEYILNDDGSPCLLVEYLLDRELYRPSINLEGHKTGWTALIRATMLSRRHVIQALLDRGANVNHINKYGKTALHYAAATGDPECTRILLERGINPDVRSYPREEEPKKKSIKLPSSKGVDNDDEENEDEDDEDEGGKPLTEEAKALRKEKQKKLELVNKPRDPDAQKDKKKKEKEEPYANMTAFEIAEDMGFLNIMLKISQYRAGLLGDVRVTRGNVDDTIKCPLGCGADIPNASPDVQRAHMAECPYRVVECPYGCGVRLLQFRELATHADTTCGRRHIVCYDCKETYVLADEEYHRNNVCKTRLLKCVNDECGQTIRWCDIEKHQATCSWRIVECPQKCGDMMPFAVTYEHCRTDCKRRRINCPQQCLSWIMWMNLDHHMRDTCPCRPVLCQFCKKPDVPLRTLKEHEEVCELRAELCKNKCGELVPIRDMKQHMAETCFNRYVDCVLSCGLKVRGCDMEAHTTKMCVNRMVDCPLGCLVDDNAPLIHRKCNQFHAKEVKYHVQHDCPLRDVVCPICALPVKASIIEKHKQSECPLRLIHCTNPGCLKEEVAKNFDTHIRFECRFRLQPCIQGCGQMIQHIRMGKHIISTCTMRHEDCPLRCGMTVRFHVMLSHLENECSRRFAGKTIQNAKQAYQSGRSYVPTQEDIDEMSVSSTGSHGSRHALSVLTSPTRGKSVTVNTNTSPNSKASSVANTPVSRSVTRGVSTGAGVGTDIPDRVGTFSRGNSRMSLLSAASNVGSGLLSMGDDSTPATPTLATSASTSNLGGMNKTKLSKSLGYSSSIQGALRDTMSAEGTMRPRK